jgi:hypothetical protein
MAKKKKKHKKTPPSLTQKKAESKAASTPALKPELTPEPASASGGNGMAGIIKTVIIAATFISIAVLSVISQGPDGKLPGVGVMAIRFGLLSLCALIYFVMLNFARLSRKGQGEKPQPEK